MQTDERNHLTALVPKVTPGLQAAREQVDRLLAGGY
jgi:hypothetical protein